jgi:hypothetical protein
MTTLEFKSSRNWIVFQACFPLLFIMILLYHALRSGALDARLVLGFLVALLLIAALSAISYVEFTCTEQAIIIRKPYSLIPFFRYRKLWVKDITGVSLWTVKGKSLQFYRKINDHPFFNTETLWTVGFMALAKPDLTRFAAYLHARGIETSGF